MPDGSSDAAAAAAHPASSAATSVTSERKHTLLLEARRERLAWIDDASMPFRAKATLGGKGGDAMAVLRSTRACQSMKSAVDVVEALYGSVGASPDSEAVQRVRQQLESCVSPADMKKATTPSDMSEDGSPDRKGSEESKPGGDDEFASSYRIFLQKLRAPECAELVVGMKHFVRSFEEMAEAAGSRMKKNKGGPSVSKDKGEFRNGDSVANGDTSAHNDADIKQLASSIHNYLNKTFELIQVHPLWKKKESNNGENSHQLPMDREISMEMTRQSLHTFIFSKCSEAIWSILSDGETDAADASVADQLAALQFVTPSHLDIPYLSGDICNGDEKSNVEEPGENEQGRSNETYAWDTALSAPISSLRSIDRQYSPGRMLLHILAVYRGVNEALSSAMNVAEKAKGTMPGADDVLPTLILTVLRGKPRHIVISLRFVDLFATQEQLRGEAGYAYTNLFGAVQFIQDLDFAQHSDDHGGGIDGTVLKAKGLSISPEEFRAGLERCMLEVKQARGASEIDRNGAGATDVPLENESIKALQTDFTIPVLDVRAARLGGEDVDISWAQRWNQEHNAMLTGGEDSVYGERDSFDDSGEAKPNARPPPLPEGFTRSYTFLSTKPDDVRVSDIPQLLQEYRMLVHTTETLLAERTAKYNSEQKQYARRMRERLENSATGTASD